MTRWLLILSLVFSFCIQPVYAEEPSRVRYKLPVVETNASGQKCLDVAQWKMVMAVASEYKKHFDWRLKIEPVLLEYAALGGTYNLIEDNLLDQIDRLEVTESNLKLQLTESEKLRLKLQKGHRVEKGVMWAVILVETVVIGFLGIRSSRVF